jgi:RNA polymerase sigma-70 factor (ECF subfamily)
LWEIFCADRTRQVENTTNFFARALQKLDGPEAENHTGGVFTAARRRQPSSSNTEVDGAKSIAARLPWLACAWGEFCAMLPHSGLLDSRIRAAQAGSVQALGELLEGCRQYLLLVANQELCHDLQAKVGASDLVQETFLEAQRGFELFKGRSHDELLAWLRQILRNNLRDAARSYLSSMKRDVHREIPFVEQDGSAAVSIKALPDSSETPSWPVRRCEQAAAVRRCLERLSVDYRQVIVLRNLELKSFVEIGRMVGRSPDAIRKLWGRAVQALVAEMGDSDVLQ